MPPVLDFFCNHHFYLAIKNIYGFISSIDADSSSLISRSNFCLICLLMSIVSIDDIPTKPLSNIFSALSNQFYDI